MSETSRQVRLFDCRGDGVLRSWEAEGEVERVLWNHFDPFAFFVSAQKKSVIPKSPIEINPLDGQEVENVFFYV